VAGLAIVGASQAAGAGAGAAAGSKLRKVAMIWKVERRQGEIAAASSMKKEFSCYGFFMTITLE
jgi:hypothetical protein